MHNFGIMMGHLCGLVLQKSCCVSSNRKHHGHQHFLDTLTRVGHATYHVLQYLGFTNCEHTCLKLIADTYQTLWAQVQIKCVSTICYHLIDMAWSLSFSPSTPLSLLKNVLVFFYYYLS